MTDHIEAVAKALSIALAERGQSTEELATIAITAYQQAVASEAVGYVLKNHVEAFKFFPAGLFTFSARAKDKYQVPIFAAPPAPIHAGWTFIGGQRVRKKSGSWWEGKVVGTYSTNQTQEGYCVQLEHPNGPVQIYPLSALEAAPTPEAENE